MTNSSHLKKSLRILKSKSWREIVAILTIILLAVTTVVYANFIANKIEKQEEAQVILWGKAIAEKAKVLKLSNEVFLKLAEEERKKVEITAKVTQLIISENNDAVQPIFLDIIRLNNQIPIVSTDENYVITDFRNIDEQIIQKGEKLTKKSFPDFYKYPPIEIKYLNRKNYIFYQESIIFQKISNLLKESSNQFLDEIRNNSSLLPILLMDKDKNLVDYGNIPVNIVNNPTRFQQYIQDFTENSNSIELDIDEHNKKILYYKSSKIASYIKWFPIVLYSILGALFFLAYSAIMSERKFEKNQIWVGMSKETAHQLGTPISSLSAWLELFGEKESLTDEQSELIVEMKHDVSRLSLIADRFSKIGSKPKLEVENLSNILQHCFSYLKKRGSKKIHFELADIDPGIRVEINKQLFEWVIENLVKNAFDAIVDKGSIDIIVKRDKDHIYIDIQDSGKGVLPSEFDKIFEPGYTTKKRGWGLGLSLCKRIIEEYFNGKIFVLDSKINKGTTIRMELMGK